MRKFRLVFLLPGGEPWVQRITHDMVPLTGSLEMECVFLSEGPSAPHPGGAWIELDGLEANPGLRRMAAGYPHPEISESEAEREFRYCRARFGEKFSREEVRKRYGTWMRQARALFRLIQPDMVWIWNGTVYRSAAFATAAKAMGISLLFAEKGVFPGSWALDPRGVNASSSLPELPEPSVKADRVAEMKATIRGWDGEGKSAWDQPERENDDKLARLREQAGGRRIIFFPGQVDSDSNIICFSPHLSGSLEALELLMRSLGDEYYFLVKPHPKGSVNADEYRGVVKDRGRVEEKIHVLDAISICDLVASINSTVAFEAVVRGKPVFLLGRGILSSRSFVAEWEPEKEMASQVKEWVKRYRENEKEIASRALAWGTFLRDEYYLFLKDGERLRARLERVIRESDAVPRGGDRLAPDELWALCRAPTGPELMKSVSGADLVKTAFARLIRRLRWPRRRHAGQ